MYSGRWDKRERKRERCNAVVCELRGVMAVKCLGSHLVHVFHTSLLYMFTMQ